MAGDFPLKCPGITVDVEDALAEEIVKYVVETGAFNIVREVGEEEVADVGGIDGADDVGEVEEGVNLESGGRGLREEVGDPVVEAVEVSEEAEKVSDDGVALRT